GDASHDRAQRRLSGPSRDGTRELPALVRDLDIASVEIVDLQLRRPSLDDVFLALTGHQAEEVRDEEPSQDRRGRRWWPRASAGSYEARGDTRRGKGGAGGAGGSFAPPPPPGGARRRRWAGPRAACSWRAP